MSVSSMSVSWAWARGKRTVSGSVSGSTSAGSASDGSKSLASTFGSALSLSWGSSVQSSSSPASRRRLCIWSRATFLDDVIVQIEKQPSSDRGVLIHTADCGTTEHDNKAAAVSYLKSLRRDRRQPRSEDRESITSFSCPQATVRRRPKSSPVPLQLKAEDPTPIAVPEKHEIEVASDSHKEPEVAVAVCSGEASSVPEARAPSDDGCKPGVDGRLQDLQRVLDSASPAEFVGLAVMIGGERGTVKAHVTDGGGHYLVALDSGAADVSLGRIEAAHVAGCLPQWAMADDAGLSSH